MQIHALAALMDTIAPLRLAEDWDNVGLLLGDPARNLAGPVLLTIDTTPAVVDEAINMDASVIISYHPVLFTGIKRIVASSPRETAMVRLLEHKIAVYSPHTALDVVEGGVADWLLDGCGRFTERGAITTAVRTEPSRTHKLVTFVPAEHVDAVRAALAQAGAGGIGTYDTCSFSAPGTGTFFARKGSTPAVGEAGRLERVDEVRLEMVFPGSKIGAVVGALHANHPYEIPAFDIFKLEGEPEAGVGAGRVGTLDVPCSLEDIAARLKKHLGVQRLRVADSGKSGGVEGVGGVGVVGGCPGAGVSLIDGAIGAGCDVFVTGEMRHHDVLSALDKGCSVILAGHTNTERGYLPVLAEKIRAQDGALDVRISEADRWPFDEI